MALRDNDRNASFTVDFTDAETTLLDLAADDRREVLSLSSKEELLLRLYDQIQELDLERAILEQGNDHFICLPQSRVLCFIARILSPKLLLTETDDM